MKVAFLGTPDFVKPVKQVIKKNFELVNLDQAELLVVAAYGKILPKEVINQFKFGSINIHPSLLPKYRGASPLQQAILNGDSETGVTIMKMDPQMDHGSILAQEKLTILEDETFQSLAEKAFELGAKMLIKVIPDYIEGRLKPVEQNHSQASFCKLITKEDGYFEINKPPDPEILQRMIRAYYPWPGAWTKWNDKIVKLLPNNQVQMEGKKPTDLKSFLNGYPEFPIKRL